MPHLIPDIACLPMNLSLQPLTLLNSDLSLTLTVAQLLCQSWAKLICFSKEKQPL